MTRNFLELIVGGALYATLNESVSRKPLQFSTKTSSKQAFIWSKCKMFWYYNTFENVYWQAFSSSDYEWKERTPFIRFLQKQINRLHLLVIMTTNTLNSSFYVLHVVQKFEIEHLPHIFRHVCLVFLGTVSWSGLLEPSQILQCSDLDSSTKLRHFVEEAKRATMQERVRFCLCWKSLNSRPGYKVILQSNAQLPAQSHCHWNLN